MTAQLLVTELSALIQDTKRRHPDIRAAAEKSLSDLKSLANTSESQLAADLRRRPEFIRPFLLACKVGNPKYAGSSVACIQRLVVANGFAAERLEDLLESLRECSSLGSDVQLRILQIMPSLFQRYSQEITESRLTTALQVCFVLQASKNGVISNTAAATLQQVVNDVFTRISPDRTKSEAVSPETARVSWQAELDCHQVLRDLCLIAEGRQVKSLENANVSKDFAFELIGTILLNFTSVIPEYTNFVDILRSQLLPLVLRIVSASAPYNSTVRALRIIPPIVKGFLEILPAELEMLLSMLTYLLEPDAGPAWKRVMCMETLREVYKEGSNIRRAYALFDWQENHKAIVQEQLSAISHLASEKPAIIGLGQTSSLPTTTEENGEDLDGLSALQADPLTATTGVTLSSTKTSTQSGIGLEMSSVRVALIDQLDKSDPPTVPPSYIYALALTSMNHISESLARFILPFATSKVAQKKEHGSAQIDDSNEDGSEDEESRLPTNPMRLRNHRDFLQISATSKLLEKCWPALLSTYSTFFQAALDPDFYHGAIRAFQKLIQVVTLLRLSTPRDAFLTSLAKQSLPVDAHKRIAISDIPAGDETQNSIQTLPRMSPRNLLCLRALLNLGIALGSVLNESWAIVLNTLQQADIIIGHLSIDRTLSKGGPSVIAPATAAGGEVSRDFVNEVAAVRSAASRMLSSSNELPEKQFRIFLRLLADQIRVSLAFGASMEADTSQIQHQRNVSVNSTQADYTQELRANVFVIDAFAQVIDFNRSRIAKLDPDISGWDYIVKCLMKFVAEDALDPEVRIAATDAVCKSVIGATTGTNDDRCYPASITYGLSVLRQIANQISSQSLSSAGYSKAVVEEIHNLSLQTLKSCLDHLGESITDGWEDVCELILSAFIKPQGLQDTENMAFEPASPLSRKLLRSAFSSLEAVCSETIGSVPYHCLLKLLRAIFLCCQQTSDINVGLTATSLYQSVSDSIWSGREELEIDNTAGLTEDSATLAPGQLWIQILIALCETSVTEQSEIRNNAVHACFRIVSSVADHLTSQHWSICLRDVFIRLYLANQKLRSDLAISESTTPKVSVDETAASIHTSVCELIEEYPTVIFKSKEMLNIWPILAEHVSALLSRRSLALSASVYLGFKRIFEVALAEEVSFTGYAPSIWDLLMAHNPSDHIRPDRPSNSDNQLALTAYVSCLTSLYKISAELQRQSNLEMILHELNTSLAQSTSTNYVNDLTAMTPLQIECVGFWETAYATNDLTITTMLLEAGANLVTLPYRNKLQPSSAKGPTLVAFSSTIITCLGKCLCERCELCDLHTKSAASNCLDAFRSIISRKTTWKKDGQSFTIWREASSTAVEVAQRLILLSSSKEFPKDSFRIWKSVLTIMDVTLDAGSEHDSDDLETQASDLSFDTDAFEQLFTLLIPSLGSEHLPDEARWKFAEILMLRSLIHEPHPDDSLEPQDADEERNQWLQPGRIGRVRDLPPSRRSRLCYLLMDRMFDMVSDKEKKKEHAAERLTSEEQPAVEKVTTAKDRRIAAAILPYLTLRIELVLKAYISDQPLRGRMPCPLSQKRELFYILNKSVDTAAESKSAHAQWPAVRGERLTALKRLGVAALRATRYDEKTKESLLKLVEA